MEAQQFRETVLEELSNIGQALSDPARLKLLDLLTQGERTVNELAEAAGLSTANASQHLLKLHRAGLVERDKDGLHVRYRIEDEDVLEFYRAFLTLGESRRAEIQRVIRQYVGRRDRMNEIGLEELMGRLEEDRITVLDVRPREEFEQGHLPDAVSIPLDELEDRLEELPEDKEVAAYCRGPYCVLSVEAVQILRDHGYEAVRMSEGVLDFRTMDLGLDAGPDPTVSSSD